MTQVRVGGTARSTGTYVGSFNPASGLPTQGTGKNSRILKGDFWRAVGSGTIAGVQSMTEFQTGDLIYASINNAVNASDFFGMPGSGL